MESVGGVLTDGLASQVPVGRPSVSTLLARFLTGGFVRGLCGELAEPFGDRVDGRLAGGDVDHEVVHVIVAGV
jgi:hypothetical protein